MTRAVTATAASVLPSRRDWLRIGVLGALAPHVSAKPEGSSSALPAFGRAKSVVVIFTSGGQSQLDMWDPKPDAPVEIRGAFGTTQTTTPGLRVCEHLPRMAALANRYCVLRSMTHDDLDHGSACYLALTGQFHQRKTSNPPPRPSDFPALGAVLKRMRPAQHFPHTAVHVNGPLLTPKEAGPGQYGGFLGRAYEPAELGNVTDTDRLVEALDLPSDVPAGRLKSRRDLLAKLDPSTKNDPLAQKAYELVNAPKVQAALDLDREPEKLRDRYGRHRSGQACLLARRLVEAEVPWITVFFNHGIRGQDDSDETDEYGWDTHNDIFDALKTHLIPRFDSSVACFLEDLHTRGLLDSTLVVIMGEFGRAPRVAIEKSFAGRGSPGRKHWAACYSVLLAGAGVVPGVFGASDRIAAYPQSDPTAPGDLAATMFHALGIRPDEHYTDATDRPYRAVTGTPVTKLFR